MERPRIEDIKKESSKFIKNNLFYLVITQPNVYFKKLFTRTLYIGLCTLILSLIYTHNPNLHELKIPTTMHSLVGFVIGLLLMFRTNTAYDRWWEGRKSLSTISTAVSFFCIKFNASVDENEKSSKEYIQASSEIKENLTGFLNSITKYLVHTEDVHTFHVSDSFHKLQMKFMLKILQTLHKMEKQDLIGAREISMLENTVNSLLDSSNACERIKNTPIPIAYALHIRMSIMIYLLTLPFGLFYDLGVWSTPIVMLIFYLIAGIEIISNEIENPFANDPNDLPVEALINSIISSID